MKHGEAFGNSVCQCVSEDIFQDETDSFLHSFSQLEPFTMRSTLIISTIAVLCLFYVASADNTNLRAQIAIKALTNDNLNVTAGVIDGMSVRFVLILAKDSL